jgi:hypothetical protein
MTAICARVSARRHLKPPGPCVQGLFEFRFRTEPEGTGLAWAILACVPAATQSPYQCHYHRYSFLPLQRLRLPGAPQSARELD